MRPAVDTVVFETVATYRNWLKNLVAEKRLAKIGLVPTMGALHDGHATLVRRARHECDYVVVSIFVNPLQFGPHEDFDRYPRTFPYDLDICRAEGVDAVLHPSVLEVYPLSPECTTKVIPPKQLIERLCGSFRPGHFEGVATVVLKLFNMVQPTHAYFGEKDYQQITVIRRLVEDLNVPVEIVGVPTVREKDGLALSSRNVYLTAHDRQAAPKLHQAIMHVAGAASCGVPLKQALNEAREMVAQIPDVNLQYLEACNASTLAPLEEAERPMVVLIAAKLGNVRLIDNVIVR